MRGVGGELQLAASSLLDRSCDASADGDGAEEDDREENGPDHRFREDEGRLRSADVGDLLTDDDVVVADVGTRNTYRKAVDRDRGRGRDVEDVRGQRGVDLRGHTSIRLNLPEEERCRVGAIAWALRHPSRPMRCAWVRRERERARQAFVDLVREVVRDDPYGGDGHGQVGRSDERRGGERDPGREPADFVGPCHRGHASSRR